MTTLVHEQTRTHADLGEPSAPGRAALTERDLVELLGAFNEATTRLQTAHDALHKEVARLKGELREANERLERSRRLAALGEMAAGIAHEVRNPLGCIRLYAGLLEQDLADRPPCRETARKIAGAVRGLDAVVSDVLAFAREMQVRRRRVPARELLERAAEEGVGGRARGFAVAIESGVDTVVCDPSLVHRALVNVVRNAAEAVEEIGAGGEIRLACRGRCEGESRWAVLSVTDTGPGIASHVRERMFNPFFTTRATGTGLGLAIVHRIVDAHGGRVDVRNRAETGEGDRGAVVELMLPDGPGEDEDYGGLA